MTATTISRTEVLHVQGIDSKTYLERLKVHISHTWSVVVSLEKNLSQD
jgi:hypothetical protein